jgi:hypothetical protein
VTLQPAKAPWKPVWRKPLACSNAISAALSGPGAISNAAGTFHSAYQSITACASASASSVKPKARLNMCSPNCGQRTATAPPKRRTPAPRGLPGRSAMICTRVAVQAPMIAWQRRTRSRSGIKGALVIGGLGGCAG